MWGIFVLKKFVLRLLNLKIQNEVGVYWVNRVYWDHISLHLKAPRDNKCDRKRDILKYCKSNDPSISWKIEFGCFKKICKLLFKKLFYKLKTHCFHMHVINSCSENG